MKTHYQQLRDLKENHLTRYFEIIKALFSEEPENEAEQELRTWLVDMPRGIRPVAHSLVEIILKHIEPEPTTLEELYKVSPMGVMFECLVDGKIYQIAGRNSYGTKDKTRIHCKPLGSELLESLRGDTPIRRIF